LKKLLRRWLEPKVQLTAAQRSRLAAWKALPSFEFSTGFERARFVVVDVETTGLNLITDTLISIGAVGVVHGRIAFADSFSVVLQQRVTSHKENILVHGISGSEQREGADPTEALLTFLEFVGKDPLVAFHVTFDETMISRAFRQYLNHRFKHPWLDLAYVMPAQHPELMQTHRTLDDWGHRFHISNEYRHNAAADALATAQLLLVAMADAKRCGYNSYGTLRDIEQLYRSATIRG
jgi:DNA polymerase-3 subunit epsilon